MTGHKGASDVPGRDTDQQEYPPSKEDWKGQKPTPLVDGSNAYEKSPSAHDEGLEEESAGVFGIPDDDLSGEGWTPPTHPGSGWIHPAEQAMEERLEEVEQERPKTKK